ncbi:MAG TPA: Gfo/Idh/MocA family oxidoreductase [Chloroflexota bacterium]|nr:Gfo/Idh/MocA family oxidoreductase [Chloroflexota bacterium]
MGTETKVYRAALVGCSRMGAFIDNEVEGRAYPVLPYSHAAGYEACPRTALVAGADLRPEVLEAFGNRYDVPRDHLYTDYHELIEKERPDILSIATQPEQRAEVILFAAEHGVRAIYAEKALCASMEEARRIVDVTERNGIALNMGTNRRWAPGVDTMREIIASGELGALKTIILYSNGTLFNTSSHWFDMAFRLNGDVPASWAQAYLPKGDELIEGETLLDDPLAQGTIAYENGVVCHALLSPRNNDIQAICERGYITARGGGVTYELHRKGDQERRRGFVEEPFPSYEEASATLRLIEDLVHSLDTGQPPRGGARIAYANTELIFAFVESHRRGGARVALPLEAPPISLNRQSFHARQPKYEGSR